MNTQIKHSRFRVQGMDCASCANKIDRALRRLDGVADVSVSVTAGTMKVDHHPDVDLSRLAKRVESLGYKVTSLADVGSPAKTTLTSPMPVAPGSDHDHSECIEHDHSGHDHSNHNHSNHDHPGHEPPRNASA